MVRKREELKDVRVRMKPELHRRLKEAAEINNHSMTEEIVARLQRSFPLTRVGTEQPPHRGRAATIT